MNVNSIVGRRRDGRPIYLIRGGAPDATETLGRLCADGSTVAGGTPRQIVDSRIKFLIDARIAVLDTMIAEKRTMKASEQRVFDRSSVLLAELEERRGEIDDQEERAALSARTRAMSGDTGTASWSIGHEPGPYRRDNLTEHSFFRDLHYASKGHADAADRLRRNNEARGLESRALGNTGAAGGSGGEFAPPLWLVDEYVKLARPGRVTADVFTKNELPAGASSINVPKVATGTTVAPQTTQNTSVSQTDLTTNSLSSGIVTVAGKQVVSLQLLEQSAIPFDQVILGDLAAAHATQIGQQVITGSGSSGQLRGYLTATSTSTQTWTQSTPTVTGFYGMLGALQSTIQTSRYAPPDTVIMHPRRWSWLASYTDTTGRPLVVPSDQPGYNNLAAESNANGAGKVGRVLGMDVFVDPNIPTNLGSGTNQDVVLMTLRGDLMLWETEVKAETFTEPYSDSMGVLFRIYNYAACIVDRYAASLGTLSGTGLVAPTFAS